MEQNIRCEQQKTKTKLENRIFELLIKYRVFHFDMYWDWYSRKASRPRKG
jgi:hypothetical protein